MTRIPDFSGYVSSMVFDGKRVLIGADAVQMRERIKRAFAKHREAKSKI